MILSDKGIRAYQRSKGLLSPYKRQHVQPASVDLTLDDGIILMYHELRLPGRIPPDGTGLAPNQFMLASTVETIHVPDNMVAMVSGKSSWARRGLLIHMAAGWVDPGFNGQITLELKNLGPDTLRLQPGVRICQVSFMALSSAAEFPYGSPSLGSHYQGQTGVTESRMEEQ